MSTPNVIPNANNEGRIGKSGQQWSEIRGQVVLQNGKQVANLDSPALTGTPTAPTPAGPDNSTKVATTSWVRTLITGIWAKFSGSQTVGNLLRYKNSGELEDSGSSVSDLLDRTNHTGLQAQSTVTNLVTDLATLAADISTNASGVTGSAPAVHTHLSADITDSSESGDAGKLVKHTAGGGVYAKGTTTNSIALAGSATGSNSAAVVGGTGVSNNTGSGIVGLSEAGTSGSASAGLFSVGTTHTERTILALADSTNNNDIMEFGVGNTNTWTPTGFITSEGILKTKNGIGAYGAVAPSASAVADHTLYLPDSDGLILVSGDGTGVSNAESFRQAIGLSYLDSPNLSSVAVSPSTSSGYRFSNLASGGAIIALEDIAITTTFQLPSGGGAIEKLVDGDGRGVTDASAFRGNIGAAGTDGSDDFTGAITIDPAGNTQILMSVAGFSGNVIFATTTTGGSAVDKTITLPNTTGTAVVTATGAIESTDIGDSTAAGQAIITGATAAAQRTSMGAAQAASDIGYGSFFVVGTAVTTFAFNGVYYPVAADLFELDSYAGSVNFIVDGTGSTAAFTYDGNDTRKFLVRVCASISCGSTGKQFSVALSKENVVLDASAVKVDYESSSSKRFQVSTQAIFELATDNLVEFRIANMTDTTSATIEEASVTITPIN